VFVCASEPLVDTQSLEPAAVLLKPFAVAELHSTLAALLPTPEG